MFINTFNCVTFFVILSFVLIGRFVFGKLSKLQGKKIWLFLLNRLFSFPTYFIAFAFVMVNSILMKVHLPKLSAKLVTVQFSQPLILYELMVVYVLTEFVFFRIWEYFMDVHIAPRLRQDVTNEAMEHLLKVKYDIHKSYMPAEFVAKIAYLERAHEIIEVILRFLIADSIGIFWCLCTFFSIHWFICVPVCIWMLGCLICMIYIGSPQMRKIAFESADIYSKNVAVRVNIVANIFNVKLFSDIARELGFIMRDTKKEYQARSKLEWRMLLIRAYLWLSYTVMHCVLLYFMFANQLDFQSFIFVNRALDQLKFPIASMVYKWSKLVSSICELSNGLTIYEKPVDKPPASQISIGWHYT